MKFETITVPVHEVDHFTFQQFVKEIYDQDFCITDAEESGNGETIKCKLSSQVGLRKDEREELAEFVKDGYCVYGFTGILLQDMINNHHIPSGLWIIDVSW